MQVTESGISTFDKLLQYVNELLPISVIELGMVILVMPMQPQNAPSSTLVTVLGITTPWYLANE